MSENPASVFVAYFIGQSKIFSGQVQRNGTVLCDGDTSLALTEPQFSSLKERRCAIVVRPERVKLSRGSSVSKLHRENNATVLIRGVTFGGNHHIIRFTMNNGVEGSGLHYVGSELPVQAGDVATVTWRPEDQTIVPADPISQTEDMS